MAFQQVQAAPVTRRRNTTPAAHLYTRESNRSPEGVETRLRVTLPLLNTLGWVRDQRIDVMVGIDEDEGKIQVIANPAGAFRLRAMSSKKTSFVLASRAIPVPAGINKKVVHSVEGRTLLINYA